MGDVTSRDPQGPDEGRAPRHRVQMSRVHLGPGVECAWRCVGVDEMREGEEASVVGIVEPCRASCFPKDSLEQGRPDVTRDPSHPTTLTGPLHPCHPPDEEEEEEECASVQHRPRPSADVECVRVMITPGWIADPSPFPSFGV